MGKKPIKAHVFHPEWPLEIEAVHDVGDMWCVDFDQHSMYNSRALDEMFCRHFMARDREEAKVMFGYELKAIGADFIWAGIALGSRGFTMELPDGWTLKLEQTP